MKSINMLDRYFEERNDLLQSITALLEKAPRVKAAWLFGSLGRGDEDALSDLDLWVVVDDNYIDHVIAGPLQHITQIGNPVLTLEAPQNAPEGGSYLMACFDAPVAPHIIDWYWQPQTQAYIPDQIRLLFDNVGLIHKDQPILFPARPISKEITERPDHFISFFWMMLMITAKHAYRSPWAAEMELLPFLIDPIIKTQIYLGQKSDLLLKNLPSHQSPDEKIRLLLKLADHMSQMMETLSQRGEVVPGLIIPGAYRYLKMLELCPGSNSYSITSTSTPGQSLKCSVPGSSKK